MIITFPPLQACSLVNYIYNIFQQYFSLLTKTQRANTYIGNSLAVQWLGLGVSIAGAHGSISDGGTKISTPPPKMKHLYINIWLKMSMVLIFF